MQAKNVFSSFTPSVTVWWKKIYLLHVSNNHREKKELSFLFFIFWFTHRFSPNWNRLCWWKSMRAPCCNGTVPRSEKNKWCVRKLEKKKKIERNTTLTNISIFVSLFLYIWTMWYTHLDNLFRKIKQLMTHRNPIHAWNQLWKATKIVSYILFVYVCVCA